MDIIDFKVKISLYIKRKKNTSVMVACIGSDKTIRTFPKSREIPSNMSLDYLFEAAKAEYTV
jgi:hypothetical protein